MLAFTSFTSPAGLRWNFTAREHATAEGVIEFCAMLETASLELIGAGWIPTDPKAPIVWPPADQVADHSAEVKRAAQTLAVEIAQEQALPQAKRAILSAAIAAKVLKNAQDAEGVAALVAAGKARGLEPESMLEKMGSWVQVIMAMAEANRAPAPVQVQAPPPAPVVDAPPVVPPVPVAAGQAPPPPPNMPAMPPAGGGVIIATKMAIKSTTSSGAKVDFYAAGHRYADLTWPKAESLIESFPVVAQAGYAPAHFVIGQEYAINWQLTWANSERVNSKGTPYKDITGITIG